MIINKAIEGWAADANAHALRVELSAEHAFLLPFDQFVHAEIRAEAGEQRLRIVFATHEVVVHGHSLRRLFLALQARELAVIALVPDPGRAQIPDGQPVLRRIVVTETETSQPEKPQTP